jgi:diguanylate cyclase (GGDEF)-like protein/PAS domain S-box-containing protein
MWGQLNPDQPLSFTPGYVRTTRDGRTIEVKTHVLDTGGWVRTFADVTDYFKARQALERSELHLRALFDAIPDRVWLKDPQGRFIMCNPSAANAYGLNVEQILGQPESALGADVVAQAGYADTDARALNSQAPVLYEQELPLQPGGAATGVFEVVKRAVFDGHGAPLGVLGMARDVTERKRAEAQIERLAFYDPLTGLCNRRLFHDRLEQALAASARSQQWAAVCFIDLDNFKDLNDTQGHDQGDLLLKQVGQRLQAAVREQDTVARLGGDEFVVLLERLGLDEGQAALYANAVGETLLDALNHPYELQRGEHHNTPSVGITLFRDHGERIEDVLKRADLAMYQSKSAGRNTVRFFDPAMQAAVQRRSELARDLRDALSHDELALYSQPVVDVSGTVVGHEALLRWQQAQRGMVSPAEFIPVAERTALILPIGDWVLRHACRHLARWAQDPATAHWTLAVNLSARQLRQPDFVDSVRAVLRETGANPALLKLELTESLLLHDVEDTIVKMTELARDGIRFSLDDFGTGYSSLSYLKRLPLSLLKIDKSFVRDLLTDPNDALIAHTILQLAESLGLEVVAEGVETEGQRELLQVMGCKAFQGYLFGRPAPI